MCVCDVYTHLCSNRKRCECDKSAHSIPGRLNWRLDFRLIHWMYLCLCIYVYFIFDGIPSSFKLQRNFLGDRVSKRIFLIALQLFYGEHTHTKFLYIRISTHISLLPSSRKNKMKLNYLCVNQTFSINYFHVYTSNRLYVCSPYLNRYISMCLYKLFKCEAGTSFRKVLFAMCSLIRIVVWPQVEKNQPLWGVQILRKTFSQAWTSKVSSLTHCTTFLLAMLCVFRISCRQHNFLLDLSLWHTRMRLNKCLSSR